MYDDRHETVQTTLRPGTRPVADDPFLVHVLRAIPPEVLDSFSDTQIHAVQQAVLKTRNASRHLIDLRGTIPLFFVRLYFVFLLGQDRRQKTLLVTENRRRAASHGAFFLFAFMSLLVSVLCLAAIAVVVLFLLYVIKSLVGIDLFPDSHLSDLLGW